MKNRIKILLLFCCLSYLLTACTSYIPQDNEETASQGYTQSDETAVQEHTQSDVPPTAQLDFLWGSDAIPQRISSIVEGIQALPQISTRPLPIDISKLYSLFAGDQQTQDLQHDIFTYPEDEGYSETLYAGALPFYDTYLNVESVPTDTRIHYEASDYQYIDAVFDPTENADYNSTEQLGFSNIDTATARMNKIASECGFEFKLFSYTSLSSKHLQELYDYRRASDTLRKTRYSIDGSATKNAIAVADKPVWTQEDECYYIKGNASFSDVPIYGGDIDAYINSTGIIQFSATRLLEVTSQGITKPLQSGEAIVSSLDRITEAMYSEDAIVVSDAQLYYYPSDADTYTPLWMFSLQYTFTNPDQVKENRTALVWIDACTAEEVIFRETA